MIPQVHPDPSSGGDQVAEPHHRFVECQLPVLRRGNGPRHAEHRPGVEVWVQSKVASEPLEHCDGPGAGPLNASGGGDPVPVEALDDPEGDAQDASGEGGRQASRARMSQGSDRTHWRTGTAGSTSSTMRAAKAAMRRPPQQGQKPRPLQEKGTSLWWSQLVHWSQAKPEVGSPQWTKPSSSRRTCRGRPLPWRDAVERKSSRCLRKTSLRTPVWVPAMSREEATTASRRQGP